MKCGTQPADMSHRRFTPQCVASPHRSRHPKCQQPKLDFDTGDRAPGSPRRRRRRLSCRESPAASQRCARRAGVRYASPCTAPSNTRPRSPSTSASTIWRRACALVRQRPHLARRVAHAVAARRGADGAAQGADRFAGRRPRAGMLLRIGYASGARRALPGRAPRCIRPPPTHRAARHRPGAAHARRRGALHARPRWTRHRARQVPRRVHLARLVQRPTAHVQLFGQSTEPVCWMQLGYAKGLLQRADGLLLIHYRDAVRRRRRALLPYHRPAGAREWPDAEAELLTSSRDPVTDHIPALQDRLPVAARYAIDHDLRTDDLVGTSPGRQAASLLKRAAHSQVTVLLQGETGRQRAVRARAAGNEPARRAQGSWRSTGAALPKRSSSRSCSASKGRLHRRSRPVARRAASSRRHAVPRRGRRAVGPGAVRKLLRAAGRRGRAHRRHAHASRSTCAWSRRPRRPGAGGAGSGVSARTCSTASTSTR